MEALRKTHFVQVAKSRGDGSTALGTRVEDVFVHVQTVGVQAAQQRDRPFFWTLGEGRGITVGLVVELFAKRLGVRRKERPNSVRELNKAATRVAAAEERDGVDLETVRVDRRGPILVERIGNHGKGTDQSVHVGLNQIVVDVVVQDQFAVSTEVQVHLSLLVDFQKG